LQIVFIIHQEQKLLLEILYINIAKSLIFFNKIKPRGITPSGYYIIKF